MSAIRYRVLDWDSQWFGFPIGRADLPKLTAAAAAEVDEWAAAQGLRCVYVYADEPVRLDRAGFDPVDVRVEYELDPVSIAKASGNLARSMRPEELEQVCDLSRRLFAGTRFSRDARFPCERVRELYAEWVRRDSAGGVPGCLVLETGADLAGFVTGRMDPDEAAKGSIGLIGVAEVHRGKGWGQALLDQICGAFVSAGAKRVNVVTQESNTAACRLYAGRGGRVVSRGQWYHRWLDATRGGRAAKP
jgi:dTDP-4-amino-4,6-dideoxy-D-galactose acyltransferase